MKSQVFDVELTYQLHNTALKKKKDVTEVAQELVEHIERKLNNDAFLEKVYASDITTLICIKDIQEPNIDIVVHIEFDVHVTEKDLAEYIEAELVYISDNDELVEDEFVYEIESYTNVGLVELFINMVEAVDD